MERTVACEVNSDGMNESFTKLGSSRSRTIEQGVLLLMTDQDLKIQIKFGLI